MVIDPVLRSESDTPRTKVSPLVAAGGVPENKALVAVSDTIVPQAGPESLLQLSAPTPFKQLIISSYATVATASGAGSPPLGAMVSSLREVGSTWLHGSPVENVG